MEELKPIIDFNFFYSESNITRPEDVILVLCELLGATTLKAISRNIDEIYGEKIYFVNSLSGWSVMASKL